MRRAPRPPRGTGSTALHTPVWRFASWSRAPTLAAAPSRFDPVESAVVVVPEVVDRAPRIDVLALLVDLGLLGVAVGEAGLGESQLRAARLVEKDRAQRHLLDGPADSDHAVVAQECGFARSEALRKVAAELGRVNEIARREVMRRRDAEPAALVRVRLELFPCAREERPMQRMRVADAVDVGARAQDLGVDRPLEVAHALAAEDLAVEVDQDEIVLVHLLEPDVAALEPHAAVPRIAHRAVPERHVVVALELEDAVRPREVPQAAPHLVVLDHDRHVVGTPLHSGSSCGCGILRTWKGVLNDGAATLRPPLRPVKARADDVRP